MRRNPIVPALLAAALMASASRLGAQQTRLFGMFSVGPAVPVGTFGQAFNAGWSVSAAVGRSLANPALAVRATASYGSFKESSIDGYDLGGSSTPLSVTGDVLYHFGASAARVRPYVLGGVGFSSVGYSASYSTGESPGTGGSGYSQRDNGVAFGAGGGVMMQRGKVGFFAEGRYTAIPGSEHSHIPVAVGVRVGGR